MIQHNIKVVACATVIEELLPLIPKGTACEVLDFNLHLSPEKLRSRLQKSIDDADTKFDTVILGYGLCSMATVGLHARNCTLIVPRADDCITIFLGSRREYKRQIKNEPGTYYLTKGWIEASETPFSDFKRLEKRYGLKCAARMTDLLLKNYSRLAYIDTGHKEQDKYREYARNNARRFSLRFEELLGSPKLVRKMILGPWDDDFVVARPGTIINYSDFRMNEKFERNSTDIRGNLRDTG